MCAHALVLQHRPKLRDDTAAEKLSFKHLARTEGHDCKANACQSSLGLSLEKSWEKHLQEGKWPWINQKIDQVRSEFSCQHRAGSDVVCLVYEWRNRYALLNMVKGERVVHKAKTTLNALYTLQWRTATSVGAPSSRIHRVARGRPNVERDCAILQGCDGLVYSSGNPFLCLRVHNEGARESTPNTLV